jgi:hypothetical protein
MGLVVLKIYFKVLDVLLIGILQYLSNAVPFQEPPTYSNVATGGNGLA